MSASSSNQEYFHISPRIGDGLRLFLYSQLFVTPQLPAQTFNKQTVIVTGANPELVLEAAQHFYRLDTVKLILAARTIAEGQKAKEYILRNNPQRSVPDAIEIWSLDLSSIESTLAFASRAKAGLPYLDVLIINAGINSPHIISVTEARGECHAIRSEAVATSSDCELRGVPITRFPELNTPDLYAKIPCYEAHGSPFTRELITRLGSSTRVNMNLVDPGLCISNLDRKSGRPPDMLRLVRFILNRTTEVGSRALVLAASAPASSHGES
ncbi:NAD(P)-binding protein [Penicillium tannophilum]|nr:NAD(P)-binding protein [Penicillium tannophilum]